jgi:hypothetical protein
MIPSVCGAASALALAVLAVTAAPARAQHCHIDTAAPAPHGAEPSEVHVEVTTRFTAGAAEVDDLATAMVTTRSYQGADLAVGVGWRRFDASIGLGAYAVEDQGVGVDDLRLAAMARLTPTTAPIAVRAVASVSVPTGDADAGRGMGHVMGAAGLGARWLHPRVRLDGAVLYAHAFGDGAEHSTHTHGAGLWPLIDPMNAREVVVTATAAARLPVTALAARVGADLGAPVGHGEQRVYGHVGLEYARARYHAVVAASTPLVGDAFVARGQLTLGYRY